MLSGGKYEALFNRLFFICYGGGDDDCALRWVGMLDDGKPIEPPFKAAFFTLRFMDCLGVGLLAPAQSSCSSLDRAVISL